MTSIASTTNTNTTASTSNTTGTTTSTLAADFNTFLTLLTTQMQYQDPLNPTDSTEYTSQLAQFAGVEQQINTNTNLSTLISLQETQQNATAVNYLGSRVEYDGGQISLQNGYSEFKYTVGSGATNVTVSIYDQDNKLINSSTGSTAAGEYPMVWDGTDSSGNTVSDGTYTVKVTAFDSAKNAVDVSLSGSGEVTGVTTDSSGKTQLKMGDATVALSDVKGVAEGTGMTSTELSAWGSVTNSLSTLIDGLIPSTDTTTDTTAS